ncbi:DUF916 domain-containing protein [Kineosporia sp. J2-2]|uniref:DUF916 domain-containing protein n=1 Tax=Kineosporia corallincola TaxID=2835133 RepID=A0ABS5TTA0_9ACTN|nr:DUF916 domain-containing protein [Kineosporia corallincola]MBT0774033.1 DUF916 domain-containing protein [Kineosporia corallincola]
MTFPSLRRIPVAVFCLMLTSLLLPSSADAATTTLTPAPLVTAPATEDPDNAVTWGVGPAPEDGQPTRAAFVHELTPGKSISDTVRVTNFSTGPLTFQMYAQDAINTSDGGFDLLSRDEASRDIGLWVRIPQRTVTVPARSRAEVPFRIEVPADAGPGDHSGGIVAALLEQATDGTGRNVIVERRVGTRIYGRVPGAVQAALTAGAPLTRYSESLNPFRAGAAKVTYTVHNSGNVRLAAQPSVSVKDLTGRVTRTATGAGVREVLPGQSVTMIVEVPHVWPLGRLTVEAAVTAAPVEGAPDDEPAPRGDSASGQVWAWPWAALAVVLLIVLLLALRRRARRTGGESAPDDTTKSLEEVA